MELTRVIIGQVVTEKAERLKASDVHTYTLRVNPDASKIDVKRAVEKFFDVEVDGVRMQRVGAKSRLIGAGKPMEKRHPFKKALVTLAAKSKALDLASFKTVS